MENDDEKSKKNYDVARESRIMQERSVSGKSMFFFCNLHEGEEFYRKSMFTV